MIQSNSIIHCIIVLNTSQSNANNYQHTPYKIRPLHMSLILIDIIYDNSDDVHSSLMSTTSSLLLQFTIPLLFTAFNNIINIIKCSSPLYISCRMAARRIAATDRVPTDCFSFTVVAGAHKAWKLQGSFDPAQVICGATAGTEDRRLRSEVVAAPHTTPMSPPALNKHFRKSEMPNGNVSCQIMWPSQHCVTK